MKRIEGERVWAVIIANKDGRFWDYAKRKPYYEDRPYLFPNEASARGYAAWLKDWAAARRYGSSVEFLPVNVKTTDMSALPLAWDLALNRVVLDA